MSEIAILDEDSQDKDDKERLLAALWATKGLESVALSQCDLSRADLEYFKEDPFFKAEANEIQEKFGDFVEQKLMQKINEGDVTAIIYYCKTKLKHRGYYEKK